MSLISLPTIRPAGADAPAGFLHVQGRDILDGQGRTVLLRGINVDNFYYFYPDLPPRYGTQENIRLLAEMGTNLIRLGFHWSWLVGSSFGTDLIDEYLDWCEEAGIYVLLDLHVVPPDGDVGDNRIWDDPDAQQQFVELWASLASRYRDRTIVAGYDLYNEPGPPDPDQWWDLAQRALDAIRAVDTRHIVVMECVQSNAQDFHLFDDPNIVYSYHDYEPFVVTHAGASWIGDSLVPDDYSYPGRVLTNVEWIDWSEDAAVLEHPAGSWTYWDSGTLKPPAEAEWATVKPFAWGSSGDVYYDDLALSKNDLPQHVWNAGMEEPSWRFNNMPANWLFWTEGGFEGAWSSAAHGGERSLRTTSLGSSGYGVWSQSNWILTDPLFPVKEGDRFRVRGWIRAPHNAGGCGIGLDYLKGAYKDYDAMDMFEFMRPIIQWSVDNDVPLYVGEFGSMRHAPGISGYSVIFEKIALMNFFGLHWSLWSFRDTDPQGFGLYHGDYYQPASAGTFDQPLYDILRWGLAGNPFIR